MMQTVRVQAKGTRRVMRRSLTKMLVMKFDAVVVMAEKWLVDEDRHVEAAVRWFLLLAALYLVGQVVRACWVS